MLDSRTVVYEKLGSFDVLHSVQRCITITISNIHVAAYAPSADSVGWKMDIYRGKLDTGERRDVRKMLPRACKFHERRE